MTLPPPDNGEKLGLMAIMLAMVVLAMMAILSSCAFTLFKYEANPPCPPDTAKAKATKCTKI